MNLIFFDDQYIEALYPLTFTRPAALLRCGILTIAEKWQKRLLSEAVNYFTADYLSEKYPAQLSNDNLLINSRLLPNAKLMEEIKALKTGMQLIRDDIVLAARLNESQAVEFKKSGRAGNLQGAKSEAVLIERNHNLFTYNSVEIKSDFELLTKGRTSQKLSSTNRYLQNERIFVEKNAKVEFSILNPDNGYIYIAENAEITENTTVRGSLALNEHAVLKMGAKVYGATTLGPYCKAGGEINNSIFTGYSNKAHDGFLGNAVIGEWCNIGADSNNSNLKNNYDQVKLWNYNLHKFERTGLQFCGLIMGDHSKCGINTMFNTGTVVGLSANIFGAGFPRNFIPSFSWGGAHGFKEYTLPKALKTAEIMMSRRNISLDENEQNIMSHVFEATKKYRNF